MHLGGGARIGAKKEKVKRPINSGREEGHGVAQSQIGRHIGGCWSLLRVPICAKSVSCVPRMCHLHDQRFLLSIARLDRVSYDLREPVVRGYLGCKALVSTIRVRNITVHGDPTKRSVMIPA